MIYLQRKRNFEKIAKKTLTFFVYVAIRILDSNFDVLQCGVIAQLGERLNGIQEVRSSILLSSTNNVKRFGYLLNLFFY